MTTSRQKDILAIDFGTTNTYLATGNRETMKIDAVDIVVQARQMGRGLSTAILFSNDSAPILGDRAINWFYTASDEDRRRHGFRLSSHFKPDIARDPKAFEDATAFLQSVLTIAHKNHVDLEPEQMDVYFGVPCQASPEYKKSLRQIAQNAGYGEVSLLEEPYGALFYHEGDRNVKDILRTCVFVIDFGGGTCDFTLLRDGKIVGLSGWGDMNLGGRLFDDLFFQWYCEQNPEQAIQIRERNLEYFVRTQLCREVKEDFSVDMVADRNQISIPREVGRFGMLRDMTVSQFEERARHYRPSESFLVQFQSTAGELPDIFKRDEIDLIHWFESVMEEGFRKTMVDPDRVDTILLAGGSSAWYFVSDCCERFFGSTRIQDRIRLSRNVFAAISEGMVKYRFLCDRASSQMEKLQRDVSDFSTQLATRITRELGNLNRFDIEASDFFQRSVRPVLVAFRQKGGTIESLKAALAASITERDFADLVTAKIEKNVAIILPTIENDIREWFRRHGVDPDQLQSESIRVNGIAPHGMGDNLMDVKALSLLTTTIASCIVASILGGGGTALLMAGPVGLIIGFALGFFFLRKFSDTLVEKIPLHRWMTSMWLSDQKIDTEMRELFVKDFQKSVNSTWEKEEANICQMWQKKLLDVVRQEIEYLKKVDLIRQ